MYYPTVFCLTVYRCSASPVPPITWQRKFQGGRACTAPFAGPFLQRRLPVTLCTNHRTHFVMSLCWSFCGPVHPSGYMIRFCSHTFLTPSVCTHPIVNYVHISFVLLVPISAPSFPLPIVDFCFYSSCTPSSSLCFHSSRPLPLQHRLNNMLAYI